MNTDLVSHSLHPLLELNPSELIPPTAFPIDISYPLSSDYVDASPLATNCHILASHTIRYSWGYERIGLLKSRDSYIYYVVAEVENTVTDLKSTNFKAYADEDDARYQYELEHEQLLRRAENG